jgi:hypothetical protein
MDRKGGRGGIKINKGMARVWDEEEVRGREMSPAQRDVFLIVDEYWKRYGCSPTLREIAYLRGKMGMGSTKSIVDRLVKLGVVKKMDGVGRTIRPAWVNYKNLKELE